VYNNTLNFDQCSSMMLLICFAWNLNKMVLFSYAYRKNRCSSSSYIFVIRRLKNKPTVSGVNASLTLGGRPPLPFSPTSLPSSPFPSHLIPSPPSPPLPLEVGPLNPARGSGGAVLALPAGSGAEPQPKSNLVHFSLKIGHLVAKN